MEIRNLSPEQIEEAMEKASAKYGGNLYLKSNSVSVKLPEPQVIDRSYTKENVFAVYDVYQDGSERIITSDPDQEVIENFAAKRREQIARDTELYADDSIQDPITSIVRFESSVYVELKFTNTHKYVDTTCHPLNKKGTRYRVWPGVKSSRRPGSRVSPEHPIIHSKPRRIASACWHAHRDLFYAIFDINPNAVIKTALADYNGLEDFERKFPGTAHGHDGPFGYPVVGIGQACNCDEGDYPEFATEGLSEEQYDLRVPIWEDFPDYCHVKAPKRDKALLPSSLETLAQ